MCRDLIFITYWLFGIGVAGAIMLIAGQRIRARWPGVDQHRVRGLMMLPIGFAAMVLGMCLWLFGTSTVANSLCGPLPDTRDQDRRQMAEELENIRRSFEEPIDY